MLTSSWCCAVAVVRSVVAASSSRPAAACVNALSTSDQKRPQRRHQPRLLRRRALRRRQRLLRPDRLLEIRLHAVERLPPRHHRIGLGAVGHVAHGGGDGGEVVLDSQQLQRVEAVALADARLLVPELADLVDGVQTERQDQAQA